ncbi:unnamed protein product [Cyprideis torosa]|uniref:Uncharacterized protein n=1 Tax=Cyprideis torosa TaxID=163714 RepID=A0A7R8X1U9_9CRUS|nr:unnamed protein product [Cyprideis torosa]CAG0911639.1 unnamed protein product [Cyprideis torosa]
MLPGVGVFGTSNLVYILVPELRKRRFQINAIWGGSQTDVDAVAKDLEIPFATIRMDDVLLHKDVALVFILCPPALQVSNRSL